MPNHLEHVVRPAQSPNIRPGTPLLIFEPPKIIENPPNVWGKGGDNVFDLQASASQELPQPKFEELRTYDTVRVYNPDDREQHIDTEQMTEYQGRNKISPDRIILRFAKNQNTENTEVISRGNRRTSNIE